MRQQYDNDPMLNIIVMLQQDGAEASERARYYIDCIAGDFGRDFDETGAAFWQCVASASYKAARVLMGIDEPVPTERETGVEWFIDGKGGIFK